MTGLIDVGKLAQKIINTIQMIKGSTCISSVLRQKGISTSTILLTQSLTLSYCSSE